MKRTCTIAILMGILIIFSTPVFAAFVMDTYFVKPAAEGGNDANDGLSWETAKATLAAAIAASSDGDKILVKYGEYTTDSEIVLSNTNRKISSDDGTHTTWETAAPDNTQCTISGGNSHRVFNITGSSVNNSTVIKGLKITEGDATTYSEDFPDDYGGGIYIGDGADPVIDNCRITYNVAGKKFNGFGGGIAIVGSGTNPTIQNCTISNNIASTGHHGYGGGIYVDHGDPYIYNNTIQNNTGSTGRTGLGGGIYCTNSSAEIRSNTIDNNLGSAEGSGSGGWGGGIYIFSGASRVWENTITNNIGTREVAKDGRGGGIYCSSNDGVQIYDNDINNNTASTQGRGFGGGVEFSGDGALLRNNTITDNIASSSNYFDDYFRRGAGGGIYMTDSGQTCTENVILRNTASVHGQGKGGGIHVESSETVTRNVIARNVASVNADGYGGGAYVWNAGGSVITNNTFFANAQTTSVTGSGNGSGLYYYTTGSSTPTINSCIFAGHNVTNSDGVAIYLYNAEISMDVYDCAFHDNTLNATDNVTLHTVYADPSFTDPENDDFTLRYDSPCIDRGSASTPVPENGGWRVDIGAYEYTGTRVKQAVTGTGEILFGGQVKAKVNVTEQGSLTAIDIIVYPGETHLRAPASVSRWFNITPTGTGATFNLTLTYKDSELNGETESELKLYRWTGKNWDGPKIASASDTDENWLTVNGQTHFSDWVISDAPDDSSLPVNFSTFTAKAADGFVTLRWKIENENENLGFQVYRSDEENGTFSRISDFVPKSEDMYSVGSNYTYVDNTVQPNGIYYYYVESIDVGGNRSRSKVIKVVMTSQVEIPERTLVFQNFPNPFNPETWIPYQLSTPSDVTIRIYNVNGLLVRELSLGRKEPGIYIDRGKSAYWDGRDSLGQSVSSGVYYFRFDAGGFHQIKKMVILK